MNRRAFLASVAPAILLPANLAHARALVRSGALGRIVFCRAPRESVNALRFLLDQALPVCEMTRVSGMLICGSRATLSIDRRGCRVFGPVVEA